MKKTVPDSAHAAQESHPVQTATSQHARHVDDLALMRLVADGDARARRLLAVRLVARVRRATRALMHDAMEAEDAAQDALEQVLLCASRYRGDSPVESWADRITIRTALRQARRTRMRRAWFGAAPPLDPDCEASSARDDPWTGARLRMHLDRLSPAQRQAVVLRHVFDYTNAEIAEVTGRSPHTVKKQVLRARTRLRRWLERDFRLALTRRGAA